jgi:N-acetylglucosaminylphosphatidylinositol deacetylase
MVVMVMVSLVKGKCHPRWPNKPTLLIIAHPDDESMFFGPTLSHLVATNQRIVLLCLSRGDYYGVGSTRQHELIKACEAIGIPSHSIVIVNDKELPDDPRVSWPLTVISHYILKAVADHHIERIVTFDGYGVSGHVNHIAINHCIRSLLGSLPQDTHVLLLKSVCVWRKYLSVIEGMRVILSNESCYVVISSWNEWLTCQASYPFEYNVNNNSYHLESFNTTCISNGLVQTTV